MRNLSPVVVCSLVLSIVVGTTVYWLFPTSNTEGNEVAIKLLLASCIAGLAGMCAHAILYVLVFEGANRCKETFNSPFTSQWRIDYVKGLVRSGHTLKPLTAVNLIHWLRHSHIKYVLCPPE